MLIHSSVVGMLAGLTVKLRRVNTRSNHEGDMNTKTTISRRKRAEPLPDSHSKFFRDHEKYWTYQIININPSA
jgi:hypothetical protein